MAHNLIEAGFASAVMVDAAKKGLESSASFRVSPANARAYLAAADQSARDASKVGLLLSTALAITSVAGLPDSVKVAAHVGIDWISDNLVKPTGSVYRSNKWKVTGRTTNGVLPAIDTVYIPEALLSGVTMESDGISASLTTNPTLAFVTQFLDTALSKFGTAFTSVLSIQRNDE